MDDAPRRVPAPPSLTHAHAVAVARHLPADYVPYGLDPRDGGDDWGGDCSTGCRWYAELSGHLGADWGVCMNPASHRAGLLTFEHQGCRHHSENPTAPAIPDLRTLAAQLPVSNPPESPEGSTAGEHEALVYELEDATAEIIRLRALLAAPPTAPAAPATPGEQEAREAGR